jgi:hypothetical protein
MFIRYHMAYFGRFFASLFLLNLVWV